MKVINIDVKDGIVLENIEDVAISKNKKDI